MPASVRDILLLIKTKEDAQRSINGISSAMRRASSAADAASARARAAALRAQAVQGKATGATKDQIRALEAAARAQDLQAASIEEANRRTTRFGQTIERVGHLSQTAGLLIAGAGAAGLYGLKQAIDVATDWDKQVRLTFTQVDKRYKPSLAALGDIGLRVSQQVAIPFETIQEALFDVFSSTEANLPQAEQLLKSFAKAAVAGNTDVQTASRATIGLMNAYQIPFKDVNKILDIQFQLVQEGVGTYGEWAQRIGLVTPSAVRAGQSIETMAAALSTATRLGTSTARSGTAVARAFDAMSNPKTEAALEDINVKVRDAKGNMRPLVEVFADWRKELEKLPKEDRVKNILETLKGAGSTIEARRFIQQMLLSKGGLELFQDQIKEFATDKGAFENAYNEMAASVSSKTVLLHNAWMKLKLTVGNIVLPVFVKLIDKLQQLADWFNSLPQGTQNLITKFILWSSIAAVIGGVLLVIVGALLSFAAAIATAGSALLPLVGGMLAVGVAIGIVIAALVGIGIGFYNAYQQSKPFRDLLMTVWSTIVDGANIVREFAMGLWTSFQTYVLPPLRELWSTIETKVLPAIQGFVAWWRTNMNPLLRKAAEVMNNELKPAFQTIGQVIEEHVIPALKDAAAWWERNKAVLLPVIKFLGMIVVTGLLVAAFLTGILIVALAQAIAQFLLFSRFVKTYVTVAFNYIIGSGKMVINVIKLIWNWFKNLGKGAAQGATAAMTAMTNMKNKITGFFSAAATWLVSAGRNIIAGLTGGIKSGAGAVAEAARGVAATAIAAAKSALKIGSPSKVFKDIGKDVIRGFTLGVRDAKTLKQLQTVMYRVSRDVIRSINAADIKKAAKDKMRSRWQRKLTATTKSLTKLENRRVSIQNKLAAAQKSLNDQIKARNDLSENIRTAVGASADITTLDDKQKGSASDIRKALQERLVEVQRFQANLRNLAKRGLDKETIAQLAAQGVDAAGTLVKTLNAGSDADLRGISAIQKKIRDTAKATGTTVAGDLYNQGIKAGQGLVKGLQSQMKAITKEMEKIAAALVKAIKKELGIKSPSKVFQKIGVNTARGYVNGYVGRMNANRKALTGATLFKPASMNSSAGMGNMSGVTNVRNYDQKITVNTHEIDPRKTSAELGWELEGRLS